MKTKRGWIGLAVLALLLVMGIEIATTVHGQSLSWDEGDHIFAGYMSLRTHDFGLNPEHPPMAKMVAALPLLALPLKVPVLGHRFFKDESYYDGRELLFRNGPLDGGHYSADTLIFRARLAVGVFALLLGWLVFAATREMFGAWPGLLALAFFAFEPSLVAHGAYIATDMTVSCFFFASVYAFYRYVRKPSVLRVCVAGLAAGLALAAKHSAILLLPMILLVAAGELTGQWWSRRHGAIQPDEPWARRSTVQALLHMAAALSGIAAIAILVLWSFYGFRYAARPAGLVLDPTLAVYTQGLSPLKARVILAFARFHLLPESYLYGLTDVERVVDFMASYIFGKVYAHGVWFYFPSVLAIKLTLGTMGLLLLTAWAAAKRALGHAREVWFLLAPPLVYLAAAMLSPLNIGVRHALPMLAFLLVLGAGGAWSLVRVDRRWGYAVALLLGWHVVSSARAYPVDLAYSNELWGGPSQTHRYLTDSNTDWGQQLQATRLYLEQNHIKDCWFAYFVAPFVLPSDYGIPCKLLPTFDTLGQEELSVPPRITGPVLISYGTLNGFELGTKVRNPYQSFFERTPDAVIQDGIAVFYGAYDVPLASALSAVQRSGKLLKQGDHAGAVREAEAAVHTAPNDLDPQMALADALRASGRSAEAAEHYRHALALVTTMEPTAQVFWLPVVEGDLHGK